MKSISDNILYTWEIQYGKATIIEAAFADTKAAYTGTLRIPGELDGFPVVNIERWAFAKLGGGPFRVEIPASIIQIDPWAFTQDSGNTRLNTPAFVVDKMNPYYWSLDGAIYHRITNGNCWNQYGVCLDFVPTLTRSMIVPEDVIAIGHNAFDYCELTEVTLPQNLKHIGAEAFRHCASLKQIAVPPRLPKSTYWPLPTVGSPKL